jgi:hypothetical protein
VSRYSPNQELQHFKVFVNIKYINSNASATDEGSGHPAPQCQANLAQARLNMIGNDIKVTLYALAEHHSSSEASQESEKATVTLLELEALL